MCVCVCLPVCVPVCVYVRTIITYLHIYFPTNLLSPFKVEFEVYSSLGLHIPRFNSIIISQLRGILKRKHTLPYFKLRGPPLIKRPPLASQPSHEEGCSVPPGRLTGSLVKCSRLQVNIGIICRS